TYSGIARYLSGRSILPRCHTVLLRTDRSHCFELGRVKGWGGTGTAGFRKTVLIPLHSLLSGVGLPGRPRPRPAILARGVPPGLELGPGPGRAGLLGVRPYGQT